MELKNYAGNRGMKIKLITVGKLKEKYLKKMGSRSILKGLVDLAKAEQVEIDEKTPDRASQLENRQIRKEGERIL